MLFGHSNILKPPCYYNWFDNTLVEAILMTLDFCAT